MSEENQDRTEMDIFGILPDGREVHIKQVGDVDVVRSVIAIADDNGIKLRPPKYPTKSAPAGGAAGFRSGGGGNFRRGGGSGGASRKPCPVHDGLSLFKNADDSWSHKDADTGGYCNG